MTTDRNEDDPRLLAAAEAVASRKSVDWLRLRRECGDKAVDGLQAIEKLLNQFATHEPRWPQVGDSWRHLKIKDQLGTGGDSVVFRAFDALLQRDVALKLRFPRSQSLQAKLSEGQRLARVDHPNVLKVHGVAEQGGLLGLWSELVEGESLAKWVEQGRRLGSTELITLGSELCAALAAIHGAGLVHGDIKPGNVIRANSGRFVLVDFGASVLIGDVDKVCGTPLYLAPEVLQGDLPSVASDLYGLGALLFRLASGQPPIGADSFSELLAKHRDVGSTRLLDLRPDLPTQLVAAIERSLHPTPLGRPRTAGEFAVALTACLSSTTRRRWPVAALAASAVLATVFVMAWSSWSTRTPAASVAKFVRTGGSFESVLSDGATIAPGNTFALDIQLADTTYAYVINEDSHGESYQLFPLQGAATKNPLPAGHTVRLPGLVDGSPLDWQVTSRGGMEHFYVLFSPHPIAELESGKKLDLASIGYAISYDNALADGPQRGVGGLEKHQQAVGTPTAMATWIKALLARDASLRVEQIALNNP